MIREIELKLNAANPDVPLFPMKLFRGSGMALTLRCVPRMIEDVIVSIVNVAGEASEHDAVLKDGTWKCNIPGSHFAASGTSTRGVKIVGFDGDGESYVLGAADLVVMLETGGVEPAFPIVVPDEAKEIAESIGEVDPATMTGNEKDSLIGKLADFAKSLVGLCLAACVSFSAFGAALTAQLGELRSADLVVTNVEESVVTETDPVWESEKGGYFTTEEWDEVWRPELWALQDWQEAAAGDLDAMTNSIVAATNDLRQAREDIAAVPQVITNTVTREFVEDLGIKPDDPAYSWVRPDAWTIDVEIDKSEQQGAVTVISEETDSVGRIWSNETFIATFGMAAKCSAALLDESSLNIPQIESWSALPPGGTIDSSGHFTAATSGLYRVSATATDGTTRYADVAISAERTVTNSNVRTYMADAVGGLRKSLNDDGLADLMAANFVSSNQYGTTWYTVYDLEPPRWSELGGWVSHPFAIAPRILATCGHGVWEGRDGLYGSHTFSNALGTTYTLLCNLHWVILRDWALSNGFTAREAAAVDDLAVNYATYVPRDAQDTDTGIDPGILPSFFTPESFERYLQSDATGVIGWHQGQDHAQPFPISFIRQKFTNWGGPSSWSAALRHDIYNRLFEMDFINYPLHGGDSGRPVFLRSSTLGDIVVAHHTNIYGCLADYIAGYKIIKAFAAAHGQTLKEVE